MTENPADRIIGADWIDPGRRRLDRAWRDHERHDELAVLSVERLRQKPTLAAPSTFG